MKTREQIVSADGAMFRARGLNKESVAERMAEAVRYAFSHSAQRISLSVHQTGDSSQQQPLEIACGPARRAAICGEPRFELLRNDNLKQSGRDDG